MTLSFAGGGPNSRQTEMFIAYRDIALGGAKHEVPFGRLAGAESLQTLDAFYTGWVRRRVAAVGDDARGPPPSKVRRHHGLRRPRARAGPHVQEGLPYLERDFPSSTTSRAARCVRSRQVATRRAPSRARARARSRGYEAQAPCHPRSRDFPRARALFLSTRSTATPRPRSRAAADRRHARRRRGRRARAARPRRRRARRRGRARRARRARRGDRAPPRRARRGRARGAAAGRRARRRGRARERDTCQLRDDEGPDRARGPPPVGAARRRALPRARRRRLLLVQGAREREIERSPSLSPLENVTPRPAPKRLCFPLSLRVRNKVGSSAASRTGSCSSASRATPPSAASAPRGAACATTRSGSRRTATPRRASSAGCSRSRARAPTRARPRCSSRSRCPPLTTTTISLPTTTTAFSILTTRPRLVRARKDIGLGGALHEVPFARVVDDGVGYATMDQW